MELLDQGIMIGLLGSLHCCRYVWAQLRLRWAHEKGAIGSTSIILGKSFVQLWPFIPPYLLLVSSVWDNWARFCNGRLSQLLSIW